MENDKLKVKVNVQTITASELWRLIGKQAGASEKQVEDLVRAMKAAQNEKGDKGETDDDIGDETNEDEGGSKDEDECEDENIEEYSKREYVENLESMLESLDCYGTKGQGIEGALDVLAISTNVLAKCLLEKELYQINRKENNND